MPARVTMLQFLPEKAAEGLDVFVNSVVPSIKEQQGFKGLVLMTDPPAGRAAVLTTWETEADMQATVTGNYPTQIAKLSGLLTEPLSRESYEAYEVQFPSTMDREVTA